MHSGSNTLFVGYEPSLQHAADWRPVFRQSRPGGDAGVIRRTVWGHATNPHRRLIVDVGEYRSPDDASNALEAEMLEAGARHETGSHALGVGAQVHPKVEPWSVYVTRANLLIRGLSHGQDKLRVEPLLAPILSELEESQPEHVEQYLTFAPALAWQDPPGAIALAFKTAWHLGEWAWLKFHASGGTLERGTDRTTLLVRPYETDAPVQVTGWVIEPGRKTYMGRYTTSGGSAL